MQIVTTHKNTDFDGFASVIAATLLFPESIAVLPKTLNPNVKAFLSIHKELFEKESLRGDRPQPGRGSGLGAVMLSLGGGGHLRAGSALVQGADPEAVEQRILGLIQGRRQASVQISDLMSFPVLQVAPGATMEEVAMFLRARGVTGIPVVDEGRIVGMISRRDFRKLRKDSHIRSPVKAYMSTGVLTIEPGKSPMEAVRLMVTHDIGRLPVVEHGRLIGIITRSDVMRYFYDLPPD